MTDLFKSPDVFTLPLTRGQDLFCVFRYKTALLDAKGKPVLDPAGRKKYVVADYPAGTDVVLIIDDTPPITLGTDISGSDATVWDKTGLTDGLADGKSWRLILTYPDNRTKVLAHGKTARRDA